MPITGKQDAKTTMDNIAKFQEDLLKQRWPDPVTIRQGGGRADPPRSPPLYPWALDNSDTHDRLLQVRLPAPPLNAIVAHNWKLAIAVGVVVSALAIVALPAGVVILGSGCHGGAGCRGICDQRISPPLFRWSAGCSGDRCSVRHEHLPPAVVVGPFVLRLSGKPADDPLRRPRQLCQGPDQRSRRHRELERADQHRRCSWCSPWPRR